MAFVSLLWSRLLSRVLYLFFACRMCFVIFILHFLLLVFFSRGFVRPVLSFLVVSLYLLRTLTYLCLQPASHCLVFHYTSLHGARKMLKSGIPANATVDGVPVTFRRPHDLTTADLEIFTRADAFPPYENSMRPRPFEAVIALSLPKMLLFPVPGMEKDPCLRVLPATLLSAVRPSLFGTAVNSLPWELGALLLPTEAVLRVYQLTALACLASGPGPKGKLKGGGKSVVAKHNASDGEVALAEARNSTALVPAAPTVPTSKGKDKSFFGENTVLYRPMNWNPASEDLEGGYPDLAGGDGRKIITGKGLLRFRKAVKKVMMGNRLNSKVQKGIASRAEREAAFRRLHGPTLKERLMKVFMQGETAMHNVENPLFKGEDRHNGLEEPESVVKFAKKMMQVNSEITCTRAFLFSFFTSITLLYCCLIMISIQ